MNVRPSSYFLAFALSCQLVSAENSTTPEFKATIVDGNIINAEVLAIDPKTSTTRLRFEHARNPIELKTESVIALKRSGTSKPVDSSSGSTDLLLMRNGDRFPAQVDGITRTEGTRIKTTYSGDFTLPPGSLQRISFGQASAPIFTGPRKEQKWIVLPADQPTITVNDGEMKIQSNGSAAIDAGLTDCCIIDFFLPTSVGRYVTIALGSDALEPSDKADPDSPPKILAHNEAGAYFTGNSYLLRATSRTLTLQGASITPEGRVKYTDLGIRFTMPNSGLSRQLSIGFNRREKAISFWADGKYLGKYLENGDWVGTGSAIVIGSPSSSSEITIGRISVRDWHGVISDESTADGKQGNDVVTLTSGERFTGTFISKNDSEVIFETSLSNMKFLPADLATIDFAQDGTAREEEEQTDEDSEQAEIPSENPEGSAGYPLINFGGIFALRGDELELADDQLKFTHPVLGKLTLPFATIDSILFR